MNKETEYQELSADWRHRDSLTWQKFAVVMAVVSVLVSIGFELIGDVSSVIVWTIFIFATGFAFCLTFALGQNLVIQKKGSRKMKSLCPKTERFDFPRTGSFLLFFLSVDLTIFLIIILFIGLFEPLNYWILVKQ